MKSKVIALSIVAVMSVSGLAFAQETAAKEAAVAAPAVENAVVVAAPVVVGNKVCPVTGKVIDVDTLGQNTVEYNGKVYNLCCPGCKEQFLADGEKFSKIAEAEVAAAVTAQAPAVEAPAVDAPAAK